MFDQFEESSQNQSDQQEIHIFNNENSMRDSDNESELSEGEIKDITEYDILQLKSRKKTSKYPFEINSGYLADNECIVQRKKISKFKSKKYLRKRESFQKHGKHFMKNKTKSNKQSTKY